MDFGILSNHVGECLQCASVTLLCPAGRWRGDTEGEQGPTGDEVHGVDAVFVVGFGRKHRFLCSGTEFALFFGDNHGGEAVVGRRDAYWASGGSAVTNSLLLSAVWVVGAVFADQNAPALGGILNQQGVGNSTV